MTAVVIGLAFTVINVRSCNTTIPCFFSPSWRGSRTGRMANNGERKSLPAIQVPGRRTAVTKFAFGGLDCGGKINAT